MPDKRVLKGAFEKSLDPMASAYIASAIFDWRLYAHDIAGSIAHARMLGEQGIITRPEATTIIDGLMEIREEIEQGKLGPQVNLEDIHMNVELRLFEKVGAVAGKLHTARSRNDQIALDMRLFVKEAITQVLSALKGIQIALIDLAEHNLDVIIPGYTHLQRAQPVLLAHHLLAYFEMLQRDVDRFIDCLKRADVLPLGSGALAGVPYPIDREFVARELGFASVSRNSMDAVADRDFVVEYQAAAAISMMHLSRLAEEFILWSTEEFGFILIDESFATGSSIMPQKKNPDVLELARGKSGRVYGNLVSILTAMKALPLAYNRDLQEDKEGLFDTVDTLVNTLKVLRGVVETVTVNVERIQEANKGDYILATDLADYLVKKEVSFREAHNIVGRLTRYVIQQHKQYHELALEEYRAFSGAFDVDVYDINMIASVGNRNVTGGTAPSVVAAAIKEARRRVAG